MVLSGVIWLRASLSPTLYAAFSEHSGNLYVSTVQSAENAGYQPRKTLFAALCG